MRFLPATCLLLASLFMLDGCGEQVSLLPAGQPFMVGKPATIYPAIPDGHGGAIISRSPVQVPAGWYVVPPPSTQP